MSDQGDPPADQVPAMLEGLRRLGVLPDRKEGKVGPSSLRGAYRTFLVMDELRRLGLVPDISRAAPAAQTLPD